MTSDACPPRNLSLYRAMEQLSLQMVSAASKHDWDELASVQAQVAALRDELVTCDNMVLNEDQIAEKRYLIQQILTADAEVRRHTEPWMEQVRRYLGVGATQRRVEHAYGAMR
jgi:flagellar protein FliT